MMMGCLWHWRSVFLVAIGAFGATQPVLSADYDEAYRAPRPPHVIAGEGQGRAWIDPRCRIVPMPEANLFLDTTRFRPTLVCMSRGMIADSFGYSYSPR